MKHLKEKVMNAKAGRNLKVLFITGLCLALLAAVIMPVMLAEQLQAISRAESLFAGNAAFIGSSHALYGFPAPSIPARVTGAILFFAAAVTALLIYINIIIWIWQAAAKAKFPALPWVFSAIFFHIFALILFVIVRSVLRRKCPECGSWERVKSQHCTSCSHAFSRTCGSCGAVCDESDRFCHKCGADLTRPE